MKRILLLLLALLLVSHMAFTQPNSNPYAPAALYAAKATTAQPRLIGYSYTKDGRITDTVGYTYSGNHGSNFTNNYDNIARNGVAVFPAINPSIKCDAYNHHHYGFTLSWPDERIYNTYDTAGNAITTEVVAPTYHYKHVATFLGGNITMVANYDSVSTAGITPVSNTYRFYDGANRLIEDSIYAIRTSAPIGKILYYYSTHLDSSVEYTYATGRWLLNKRHLYSYNAYNFVVKDAIIYFTTSIASTMDTFAYTGSNPNFVYHATHYSYNAGASWSNWTLSTYHFDAANRWDTVYMANWNNTTGRYYQLEKDYYYYNAAGLVDSSVSKRYDTTTGRYADTTYDKNVYYYEPVPNAITKLNAPTAAISTYPNPATDQLFVVLSNISYQGNATLQITNMIGQSVSTTAVDAASVLSVINLGGLPAGAYCIQLCATNGTPLGTGRFIKQ